MFSRSLIHEVGQRVEPVKLDGGSSSIVLKSQTAAIFPGQHDQRLIQRGQISAIPRPIMNYRRSRSKKPILNCLECRADLKRFFHRIGRIVPQPNVLRHDQGRPIQSRAPIAVAVRSRMRAGLAPRNRCEYFWSAPGFAAQFSSNIYPASRSLTLGYVVSSAFGSL